jgi:hypothetical protein
VQERARKLEQEQERAIERRRKSQGGERPTTADLSYWMAIAGRAVFVLLLCRRRRGCVRRLRLRVHPHGQGMLAIATDAPLQARRCHHPKAKAELHLHRAKTAWRPTRRSTRSPATTRSTAAAASSARTASTNGFALGRGRPARSATRFPILCCRGSGHRRLRQHRRRRRRWIWRRCCFRRTGSMKHYRRRRIGATAVTADVDAGFGGWC